MACSALIFLLDPQHSRQGHWWLPDGGFPQRLAGLLSSPLRASGRPPRSWHDLLLVFEPLRSQVTPDAPQASYRYLLCLERRGSRISCWRRYPEGLGWQRRCGPMPLATFIRSFQQPGAARRASS